MEEWHCLPKDLLFWGCGCDTVGHGQKGIWHTSFVDKQAACKETIALHLKAVAMARVKRQKLVFLLPPCLDVKNQSCSCSFFSLWVSFPPSSSAVGTLSLETGKRPCRLVIQQQQFIYLTSRRRNFSRYCCLKHALIYQLYRYGRINVSVTGSVLLPHFIGSKPEKAQAPRAQVPYLQRQGSILSGTSGF